MKLPRTINNELKLKEGSVEFEQHPNGKRVILGEGISGYVYKGRYYNAEVAIKETNPSAMNPEAMSNFMNEINILVQLKHPHIIQFFGVIHNTSSIVLEYMAMGSLEKVIQNFKHELTGQRIWQIAMDVTSGLFYLHKKEILHRDLKSMNILVDASFRVKLTDFGVSKKCDERKNFFSNQMKGTSQWMAPELMEESKYTEKADIFSFGVILWELVAKKTPYDHLKSDFQIYKYVIDGKREHIPDYVPEVLKNLIEECWNQKPEERPTIEEVYEKLKGMKNEFVSMNTEMANTTTTTTNYTTTTTTATIPTTITNTITNTTTKSGITYTSPSTGMNTTIITNTKNNASKGNSNAASKSPKSPDLLHPPKVKGNLSVFKPSLGFPQFLRKRNNKLWISEKFNHVLSAIDLTPNQTCVNDGNMQKYHFDNPNGFDWDINDNLYISSNSCVCRIDSKNMMVSIIAGDKKEDGYRDGEDSRFNGLSGLLCYQKDDSRILYLCDFWNHCIRKIDQNNYTTTFAGKGKEEGDVDGSLQEARFYFPHDIVEYKNNLYVSDKYKIKKIDITNGTVTTLAGGCGDKSILYFPKQMQIVNGFIFACCYRWEDCIVRININSKEITRIHFSNDQRIENLSGIAYDPSHQCFFISDISKIYKLQ